MATLTVGTGGTFATIQAAIDAATDGDVITVSAGTYNEGLIINKGVTIQGANHGVSGTGVRGAETIITGQSSITTSSQVTIDGVEFLDNKPLTSLTSGDTFVALKVLTQAATATGHVIENSIFMRDPSVITAPGFDANMFKGSGLQPTHRAIEISNVGAGTAVTIENNLITGDNPYPYAGDSWRSGVYSNGGAGDTYIQNNTFTNTRSGINADDFGPTVHITGNSFDHSGTGIAIGVGSNVANVTTITNNVFGIGVDAEFNFRNLTTGVTFDAQATGNHLSPPAVAANEIFYVETGSGSDHITGTGGNDVFVATAGDGNDTYDGGLGIDTVNYSAINGAGAQIIVNLASGTANGSVAGSGSDILVSIENAIGTQLGDSLTGDGNNNRLEGRGGEDDVRGGAGNDTLIGGAGNDDLRGGADDDTAIFAATAADGIATQAGGVLTINAGVDGTDTVQTAEHLVFLGADGVAGGTGANEDITIDVDASGNAQVYARNDSGSAVEDGANASGNVLTNDINIDQDVGDQKIVTAVNGSAGGVGNGVSSALGTLTLSSNGSYTYVPTASAVQYLALGETVTDTFTYAVDDGSNHPTTANLVITITGSNDAPTINVGGDATEVYAGGALDNVVTADVAADHKFEPVQQVNVAALLAADPTTIDMDAVLTAIQAQLPAGSGRADAIAIAWDYIDDNYSYYNTYINTVSAFLSIEYAKYLEDGGKPLLDVIVKYTVDGADAGTAPDRVQSLHDNLLGNLSSGGLIDKLSTGGSNPNPNEAYYQAILAELSTEGLSDLVNRPYYDGNEGSANNALAYDQGHGLAGGAGQLVASDVDGDTMTWSLVGTNNGTYGTFAIAADGKWTYTVDNSRAATKALSEGQVVTESFTAKVTDQHGATDTQVVTVTVNGSNDVAQLGGFRQGFESDSAGIVSGGAYGAVSVVDEASTTLKTPDGSHYAILTEAGGSGPFTRFDGYRATFTDGLTSGVKVYLDTGWADNQGFEYSVAANGADGNHQRDFVFHVVSQGTNKLYVGGNNNGGFNSNDPAAGSVEIMQSGWYTLQHVFHDVGGVLSVDLNLVAADGTVTHIATLSDPTDTIPAEVGGNRYGWFTSIDVPGGIAVDTVTLGDTLGRIVEDSGSYSTGGLLPFSDVDTGDTHDVEVASPVGHLGILTASVTEATATHGGAVTWTYTVDNADINHLAAGQTVTETYTLTLVDEHGSRSTKDVVITITGSNDAPTIDAVIEAVTDTAGTDSFPDVTGTLSGHDVDLVDSKSYAIDGQTPAGDGSTSFIGTYGTLTVQADGSYKYVVDAAVINALPAGSNPADTFTVKVTDNHGASATTTLTVNITGANDTPVITSGTTTQDVQEGTGTVSGGVVADINATDAEGTTLVYSLDDDFGGRFAIDPVTGVITIPAGAGLLFDYEQQDSYTLNVSVSDGDEVAHQSLTVDVANVNPETFTLPAGPRAGLTVSGGAGDDTFTTTYRAVDSSNSGPDTINGSGGHDTLVVNFTSGDDGAVGPAAVTLGAVGSSDEGYALIDVNGDGTTDIRVTGVEDIKFNLGGGHDTLNLSGDLTDAGVSAHTITVDLGAGNDTFDATGSNVDYVVNGEDGNDEITGGDINDILTGGTGDDTFHAGLGSDEIHGGAVGADDANTTIDAATYDAGASISWDGTNWQVDKGGAVIDTLHGIEKVVIDGETFWLVDNDSVDGGLGLQEAINQAGASDIILLSSEVHSGAVTINHAVTIRGVNNAGVAGTDVRGAESVLTGTVTVTAASGLVTFDGLKFLNTSNNSTAHHGIAIQAAADVTVTDSVFSSDQANGNNVGAWGDVAVYVGTSASGSVRVTDNLFTTDVVPLPASYYSGAAWNRGVISETDATTLTITDNSFNYLRTGVGVLGNDSDTISDNAFSHSGTGIALGGPVTTPIENIENNTFDTVDTDFNIRTTYNGFTFDAEAHGNMSQSGQPTVILGGDFDDTITGTQGDDYIAGDASANSTGVDFGAGSANPDANILKGLGGNDTLLGSTGSDTAVYVDTHDKYLVTVTTNSSGFVTGFTSVQDVDTASGSTPNEGTDTLLSVERVEFSDRTLDLTQPVQVLHGGVLVGTYASIQDAIDDAGTLSGDTILVADGVYDSVTVNKAVNIISVNGAASTVITSLSGGNGITLTGDLNAGGSATVHISGFTFANNNVGVSVSSSTNLDNLVIDHSNFIGNKTNGVGMGSGAPNLDDIKITDSTFAQNGDGTSNGDGDISLFGFHGDALIKDVTIEGGSNPVPNNGNADFAIQISGFEPGTYNIAHEIGNVVIDNVDITGSYAKVLFYVQGYTGMNGLDFSQGPGTSVQGHAGWGYAFYIDETAGHPATFDTANGGAGVDDIIDLTNVTVSNDIVINVAPTHPLYPLNGQAIGSIVNGTPADNAVTGTTADDLFVGGAGADYFDGGAGTDTALYTATITGADVSYNGASWVVDGGAEGTDTLQNVEQIVGGDGHHVFLVNDGDSIQAAIDAASDGDTIVVAEGVYNETVNLNKKVTLVGANQGVDGNGVRSGESVITGGVLVSANDAAIDGFTIEGQTGPYPSGIYIQANGFTITNSVLDGCSCTGSGAHAFTTQAGVTGLDFQNNLVTDWDLGAYITEGTTGIIANNHFSYMHDNSIVTESVVMLINGNNFANGVNTHVVVVSGSSTVDLPTFIDANNTFDDPDSAPTPISVYPNAPGAETIIGTNEAELVRGGNYFPNYTGTSPGPFTVDGRGGDDGIFTSDGNDDITGGAGDDFIVAGLGTDTARYTGQRSDYVFIQAPDGAVYVSDTRPGGPDGFDTLYGVETFVFSDGTYSLAAVLDHAPTAAPDLFSATENVTLSMGNVLTNDYDPDAPVDTLVVSAVNGADANVGAVITGVYGSLTLNADGTFTYLANTALAEALAENAHGIDTFSYTTTDSHGKTSTTSVVFNVTGTNDDPVVDAVHSVNGTTFSEIAGVTGSGQMRTQTGSVFFTDVDSTDLLTLKSAGTVSVAWKDTGNNDVSGQLTAGQIALLSGLTPSLVGTGNSVHVDWSYSVVESSLDFLGLGETLTVSRIVTVQDSHGGTSDQLITITINGRNDAPTVANDAAAVNENAVVPVGTSVLANDSDPDAHDAGTLRVSAVSSNGNGNSATFAVIGDVQTITGAFGTLTIHGDGTYSYTADHAEFLAQGQLVNDNFTVTVIDNHGASSLSRTEQLSIAVTGQNDAPVAVADTKSVNENATAIGNVLTNDTDIDNNNVLSVASINNGSGAQTVPAGGSVTLSGLHGTLTINADGSYGYTATDDTLAAGAVVTDTFTYVTKDAGGASSGTATLTITVTGTNDAPVALADVAAINEDAVPTSGNVLTNDTDADVGDTHTVGTVNGLAGNVGSSVTGTYGALVLNSDGTYTYTLNNALASVQALALGQQVTDTFTYTNIDNQTGVSNSTTLTVTVTGTNDVPVAVADTAVVTEDMDTGAKPNPVSGNVLTNDTDVDAGDTRTVSTVAGSTGNVGADLAGNYGTLRLNSNGSYTYTLNNALAAVQALAAGQAVTDVFAYTAIDNQGGVSAPGNLTITVNGTNDVPVAVADTATISEDATPIIGNVLGNDTDIDLIDTHTVLTVNGSAGNVGVDVAGAYGTLHLNGDGSYTYTLNNALASVQELAAGQQVTETFTYTNGDNHSGVSNSATLTVTITGTNDAPVAVADTAAINEDAVSTSGNVLTNDTDVDAGDTHTVSAVNGSAGNVGNDVAGTYGTLHLNSNGSYTYTVANNQANVQALAAGQQVTDVFTYVNSDNHSGASNTANLTVTVTGTNDAPVAVANTATINEDAVSTSGNVLTNDTDVDTGDTHTVSTVNGLWGNVGIDVVGTYGTLHLNSDGSYTYTINNALPAVQALAQGQQVTDVFTYTNADNQGGVSGSANLTVTVTGTNDAPVAVADVAAATEGGSPATGNVLTNDTDVDTADTHTVSAVNGSAGNVGTDLVGTYGTLHLNSDGSYTYTVANNQANVQALAAGQQVTDTFTYVSTDNNSGVSNTANLTVTVTGTNPAPAITTFSNDTGIKGDNITADTTLQLSGTADANSKIVIFDGPSQIGIIFADGTGAWSFNTATLAVGFHTFSAVAYDAQNHASPASAPLVIQVDPAAPNHAPTATANNFAILQDATIAIAPMVSVNDADSDAVTRYQFYDDNALLGISDDNPAADLSGYFTVNGVRQAAGTLIDVTDPSTVSFTAGATNDILWVRVSDAQGFGAWTRFNATTSVHANSVNNVGPQLVAANKVATTKGQVFSESEFITATSDANGDPIVRYRFWDDNGAFGQADDNPAIDNTGYFTLNGVRMNSGAWIEVSASDIANFSFKTTSGTDLLWAQAYDGQTWGASKQFSITGVSNALPTATPASASVTIAKNSQVSANALFTAHDSNGDTITQVQFRDMTDTSTSGYFVVNGIAKAGTGTITLTQAELASTYFQGGNGSSDSLSVRVFDGYQWGAWTNFQVNAVNQAPVVTLPTAEVPIASSQASISASTLFNLAAAVTDANGDTITRYQFWDDNSQLDVWDDHPAVDTSGYFTVNGVRQSAGTAIDVSASQLANVNFVKATVNTKEILWVRAFDGNDWGAWKKMTVNESVNAPDLGNHAPNTLVHDITVANHNVTLTASSLFSSSDADGDAIARVQFYDDHQVYGLGDDNPAVDTSGHFVMNGVTLKESQLIDVAMSDINSVTFESGSGSDMLWARVFDGQDWSSWQSFHVNAPIDHAPTVTGASNFSLATNQTVQAQTLFNATDIDAGDQILKYQFFDGSAAANSARLSIDGAPQRVNTPVEVLAADLSHVSLTAASVAETDQMWVRAFDGTAWSDWHAFSITSH